MLGIIADVDRIIQHIEKTVIRHSRLSTVNLSLLPWVLVVLGVILRLRLYNAGRSLWHDEAALARNIVNRSLIDLARPLNYNQGAPLGFLWLEKLSTLILGSQDYWLRLVPLLAGVAALALMLPLARRYTRGIGVPIAVGLFALSGLAVYYASEAKQYSGDALAAAAILLAAYPCFGRRMSARRWLVLGFTGAVGLWLSHPAIFILAGVCAALLVDLLRRQMGRGLLWLGGLGVFWMLNFALVYWLSLRHLTGNPTLIRYWAFSYPPAPLYAHLDWVAGRLPTVLKGLIGTPALVGVVLCLLGGLSLLRGSALGLALIIPPIAALAASAVQRYPFTERFLLFSLPGICLLAGEGAVVIWGGLARLKPGLAMALGLSLAGLLFYPPAEAAWQRFNRPEMGEHIKPVLAHVQRNRQPEDVIYVYYGAEHAFVYYADQFGFDEDEYWIGDPMRNQPERYQEQIDLLKGRRAWFIFSHNCYWCPVNEEAFIVRQLEARGDRIDEIRASNAAAYLYTLR